MRFNAGPINDVALDDISPRETFVGIFGRFYQAVSELRVEGVFIDLNQSIGISRAESIFIVVDQNVQLQSLSEGGPFVTFYQEVQDTSDEQNITLFNQKVMP